MELLYYFSKLALVFFLLVAEVSAQATPRDSAIERLSHTKFFAMGPTGYAGKTSQGEIDYRTILGQPDALALLEKVYAEGNLEAKAYALNGIRKLSKLRFNQLFAGLPSSNDELATMEGCLVSHKTLRDIAKQLAVSPDQGK